MEPSVNLEKIWTRFLLKLKVEHPFFAAVAMFAHFRLDNDIEIAQTIDKRVVVNPEFLSFLSEQERFSYLLHQVLHLALGHIARGTGREQQLWNIAADIAVNNIILESTSWPAAPQTAWDKRYSGDSAERIYSILQKQMRNRPSSKNGNNNSGASQSNQSHLSTSQSEKSQSDQSNADNVSSLRTKTNITQTGKYDELAKKYAARPDFNSHCHAQTQDRTEYWRSSLIKARQLTDIRTQGKTSESLERELDLAAKGQVDWRPLLWKYATPDLVDYHEFDRRFIHTGYYTETLLSEKLMVDVVIDSSGSISNDELSCFLAEMCAIHACHPQVKLRFYYSDCKLYGPYEMPESSQRLPVPLGAGGTSFEPYFIELENNQSLIECPQAVVYFTDGFGDFPNKKPSIPVLWLLTEDGLESNQVPFGTIVRLKE